MHTPRAQAKEPEGQKWPALRNAAEPQPECAMADLAVAHDRRIIPWRVAQFLSRKQEITILQCRAAEPQPECAMAILAMPEHGRDARGTGSPHHSR